MKSEIDKYERYKTSICLSHHCPHSALGRHFCMKHLIRFKCRRQRHSCTLQEKSRFFSIFKYMCVCVCMCTDKIQSLNSYDLFLQEILSKRFFLFYLLKVVFIEGLYGTTFQQSWTSNTSAHLCKLFILRVLWFKNQVILVFLLYPQRINLNFMSGNHFSSTYCVACLQRDG